MVNSNTKNVWRLLWTLIHEWFSGTLVHLYLMHKILVSRNNNNNKTERNIQQCKLKI